MEGGGGREGRVKRRVKSAMTKSIIADRSNVLNITHVFQGLLHIRRKLLVHILAQPALVPVLGQRSGRERGCGHDFVDVLAAVWGL